MKGNITQIWKSQQKNETPKYEGHLQNRHTPEEKQQKRL